LKTLTIAAASLLVVFASSKVVAANDHSGFYVGGSLGKTKLDTGHDDMSGTGFGVYGGYHFNHFFGLEASIFGSGDLGENNIDITATSFTLTPKFTYQINDIVSVYAKFGVAMTTGNISEYSTYNRSNAHGPYEDYDKEDADFDGYGVTYGIGVNVSITEHLNMRLGYDVVKMDSDMDSSDSWSTEGVVSHEYYRDKNIDTKLSNFTLGMHYQF